MGDHPTVQGPDISTQLDERQKGFLSRLKRKPLMAIKFAKTSTAIYNKLCPDCRLKAQVDRAPEFCPACKEKIAPELKTMEKIRGEINAMA